MAGDDDRSGNSNLKQKVSSTRVLKYSSNLLLHFLVLEYIRGSLSLTPD